MCQQRNLSECSSVWPEHSVWVRGVRRFKSCHSDQILLGSRSKVGHGALNSRMAGSNPPFPAKNMAKFNFTIKIKILDYWLKDNFILGEGYTLYILVKIENRLTLLETTIKKVGGFYAVFSFKF